MWAKHRNTRYYKATVESIQDTLFYMVTFDDNSFSKDLYPLDITVSCRAISALSIRSVDESLHCLQTKFRYKYTAIDV